MTGPLDFLRDLTDLADERGIIFTRASLWDSGGVEFIWRSLRISADVLDIGPGADLRELIELFPVKEKKP